jgi:hypothetical protein
MLERFREKRPPKPPISPITPDRGVDFAIDFIRLTSWFAFSMSTPESAYVKESFI